MKFVLSVAFKYLLPRRRQLSASIISLISIGVITLVVWLSIVFLSVIDGMEKKWVQELLSLYSPLRIKPKEAYFQSYYYQIDALSNASRYSMKTLGEKLLSAKSDPYDPDIDAELPASFPTPVMKGGALLDPVKELNSITSSLGLSLAEFEASFANMHLDIDQGFVTQIFYVLGYLGKEGQHARLLVPPRALDLEHLSKVIEPSQMEGFLSSKERIPTSTRWGEGVVLPQNFQKSGVKVGDRGYLSYPGQTPSGVQEMKLPIFVSGFYDPGMVPMGNKILLVDKGVPPMMKSQIALSDDLLGNHFQISHFPLHETKRVKEALLQGLKERGIDAFFTVEAYTDYEAIKPLLDQLKSDKNLFSCIAFLILLVACSNIISMLLLLVNDKRKEIAILQSMGATKGSIVMIFGLCGGILGLLSALLGGVFALYTLRHLSSLVGILSSLQGHELLHTAFYGNHLPDSVSFSSLFYVLLSTLLLAIIAGLIPALKVARISPSKALRGDV